MSTSPKGDPSPSRETHVALVSGGSEGLGLACTRSLLSIGATVAICGRDEGRLERARDHLHKDTGQLVDTAAVDLRDQGAVEGWVDRIASTLGPPAIVVANCGGPPVGRAMDFTVQDYRDALELNCLSSISLVQAAWPHLLAEDWGRIFFITSVSAREPDEMLALSSTARAAVLGFAKSLVRTVPSPNITVNVLAPGVHMTRRLRDFSAIQIDRLTSDVPSRAAGDPNDFGDVLAFLAGDAAKYVNGVVLPIDGGASRTLI